MEIRRLVDALVRKMWLIVLLSFLGAILSAIFSMLTNVPLYKSESTLYIMNKSKTVLAGEAPSYNDVMLSQQMIQDYGEIIHSRKVLTSVVNDLAIKGLTEGILSSYISVGLKKSSNVMTISAVWSDAETAARITTLVTKNFALKIKDITGNDSVGIIDEARVPHMPLPSGNSKKVLVGLLAGIVLAFGIIYVLDLFDTTIRSAKDIEVGIGLKIIGILPEHDMR